MALPLFFSSCQTMQNWLFNASDYHVFEKQQGNEVEESDDASSIYWDDFDFDIWLEEGEYD